MWNSSREVDCFCEQNQREKSCRWLGQLPSAWVRCGQGKEEPHVAEHTARRGRSLQKARQMELSFPDPLSDTQQVSTAMEPPAFPGYRGRGCQYYCTGGCVCSWAQILWASLKCSALVTTASHPPLARGLQSLSPQVRGLMSVLQPHWTVMSRGCAGIL